VKLKKTLCPGTEVLANTSCACSYYDEHSCGSMPTNYG